MIGSRKGETTLEYVIVSRGENMNLRIVRHAESAGNAQGRWQGRNDTRLTDLGREQAARLGRRLEADGYRPSRIYASPLSRTFDTARIASSYLELPIVRWDDLIEPLVLVLDSVESTTGMLHSVS